MLLEGPSWGGWTLEGPGTADVFIFLCRWVWTGRVQGVSKVCFTNWTCSKSSSFHNLAKMITKDACNFQQDGAPPHYHRDVRNCLNTRFPGRWIGRAAPIPWPPRSPRSYCAGFFLVGFCQRQSVRATPTCKCRIAPNSNCRRSCRTDVRDATSRVGRNWIQVGCLPYHKWNSYRTITVRGKTWCVCLPAYISKYCVRPPYKFIYAFQLVKRLLKHLVFKGGCPLHYY
jgi:hypothetical protein